MGENKLLKFFVFIVVYAVGVLIFSKMGGAGPLSAFLFIGERVLGSSLSTDAGGVVNLILSFIITTTFYYIISLIISFIIIKIFGR